MSRLYSDSHRRFQDEFGTRNLADRVEQLICRTEFDPDTQAFVESMDMFFLSSLDERGRPTVSYKGGDPGFVRVVDARTLVFPSYDGNGMYLSMGNLAANPQVGLLFISFERPHRIRLQGLASVSRDDPMRIHYKEAELIVRVQLSELWQNCPRYIHRYEKQAASRYVPREQCTTPIAEWKRIDLIADALPERDALKVAEAGTIGIEEWIGKVKAGDPGA